MYNCENLYLEIVFDGARSWFIRKGLSIRELNLIWKAYTPLGKLRFMFLKLLWITNLASIFFRKKNIKQSIASTHKVLALYKVNNVKTIQFQSEGDTKINTVLKIFSPDRADNFLRELKAYSLVPSELRPELLSVNREERALQLAFVRKENVFKERFLLDFCLKLILNGKVLEHGDLVPWNIAQQDNGIVAFDWEEFDGDGLLLYDLFYFYFESARLVKKRNLSISEFLKIENIVIYCNVVGLSDRRLDSILRRCIYRYCERKSINKDFFCLELEALSK